MNAKATEQRPVKSHGRSIRDAVEHYNSEFRHRYRLADPLQRMSSGLDESSSSDMGKIWDAIAQLQQAVPDLTIVLVHHTRKDDSLSLDAIRGSSRHAGELDVALLVKEEQRAARAPQAAVGGTARVWRWLG